MNSRNLIRPWSTDSPNSKVRGYASHSHALEIVELTRHCFTDAASQTRGSVRGAIKTLDLVGVLSFFFNCMGWKNREESQ